MQYYCRRSEFFRVKLLKGNQTRGLPHCVFIFSLLFLFPELMPGRDLSTQELKNLVYITMQEYFEDQKKSNSQDVDSELQDSVKRLLRPKRFVLMPFARSDDATNIGGGPIVNFWQRWAQRRLQRIQRRRQRWENFRQRQQTFFQSIGRRTAETSQRLQASLSTNNLSNGGVGEVTNAGSGHRIVMSSKVPPTGSGVDRPLTTA